MPLLQQLQQRLQQDPRLARMLKGGLTSYASKGMAILVSLITLPLTVRYLGPLEYGVWITISTSVVMLSILDLGIANTLTNFISSAYAQDDRAAAKAYFATAFWLTIAVAFVLAVLCGIVFGAVDWGALLGLRQPVLAAQARSCILISMVFFLVSLPLSLANRVLGGYQQMHIASYFAMMNSLLGLIAIVGGIFFRASLVGLMLSYCGAMLSGSLALNLWLCLWSKPWIRPSPTTITWATIRALFSQGALFFLLQLTSIVVFNSDNLVITHYLGAAEVTPYSIAWRLTSYASLLQAMLIPSFWPAFTEAYRKHDLDWVRRTYRDLERKTFLVVAAIAVAMGLFGRAFIRVWVGPAAVPPPLLLWTMVAFAILMSFTTNQALLLTASSRLRLEATVAGIAATVNLVLSLYLVQKIGAEGVILSTLLSFAIVMLVPQQLEVRRVLRGEFLNLAPQPVPTKKSALHAAN